MKKFYSEKTISADRILSLSFVNELESFEHRYHKIILVKQDPVSFMLMFSMLHCEITPENFNCEGKQFTTIADQADNKNLY